MPLSTLFCSTYTNSTCSLMKNTEILILPELKKLKYNVGTPMLKENVCEYILSKKYNALFYSVLEYINQLNILSHVKYRYSKFT